MVSFLMWLFHKGASFAMVANPALVSVSRDVLTEQRRELAFPGSVVFPFYL